MAKGRLLWRCKGETLVLIDKITSAVKVCKEKPENTKCKNTFDKHLIFNDCLTKAWHQILLIDDVYKSKLYHQGVYF